LSHRFHPFDFDCWIDGTFLAALGRPVKGNVNYKHAVEAGMRVLANTDNMGFHVQASALVTTDHFTKNDDLTRRDVRSIIESFHVIKTNPAPTKRAIRKYLR
jgi:hypothetical protein